MSARVFLLLIALFISGCSDHSSEPERAKSVPTGAVTQPGGSRLITVPDHLSGQIQTVKAVKRSVPQSISAPGEVSLDLSKVAKVSSRIAGQVEKAFVQLGALVRKGQPLLAIGSLKLDELVQEYLVSRVQADVETANYQRMQKLLNEQVVSERRYQEARGQYLRAKAVYQHVKEKLQNMGLTDEDLQELVQGTHLEGHRYILKSPLSGTIASQTVVLGQGVSPEQELFQIVDTSQVWVFANLPVEQVARFKTGDKGTIVPKGREPIQATLGYIAPIADKATLTVRLRFDVSNPQGQLKPNEYVEVRLEEAAVSILAIPVSAPTLVEGERGVFVKREGGYVFVPVQLGRESDGWIEVQGGLSIGEEVVVHGVFDLKNALLKETLQGE